MFYESYSQVNKVNKRYKGAHINFAQFEEILEKFEKLRKPPKNEVCSCWSKNGYDLFLPLGWGELGHIWCWWWWMDLKRTDQASHLLTDRRRTFWRWVWGAPWQHSWQWRWNDKSCRLCSSAQPGRPSNSHRSLEKGFKYFLLFVLFKYILFDEEK